VTVAGFGAPETVARVEWVATRTGALLIASTLAAVSAGFLTWDFLGMRGARSLGNDDFLALYSAAWLVSSGQAGAIYDQVTVKAVQFAIMGREVGAAGYMPYLNPPFVAVLLAPLALVGEQAARVLWLAVSIVLTVKIAAGMTMQLDGRARVIGFLLVVGSVPVYWVLSEGQVSLIMLVGALEAVALAGRRRSVAAGACLATLWLKPHLALLALLGLVVCGRWREGASMVGVAILVVATSLLLLPAGLYLSYVGYIWHVLLTHANSAGEVSAAVWSGSIDKFQGLNGLASSYLEGVSPLIVNSVAVAAGLALSTAWLLAVKTTRPALGTRRGELMLAASVALGLLLDPHLYPQDVVLVFAAVPILRQYHATPFLVLVTVAGIADLVLIDQVFLAHLFAWVLLVFTAWVLSGPALATAGRAWAWAGVYRREALSSSAD
jgi:hypothetical protein